MLIIFLFCSIFHSFGQKRKGSVFRKKVQNLQQIDDKLFHFGFTLGIHTQDFGFKNSDVMDKDGIVWKGDVPIISPGFSVGIISDLRLNKYFNLRFVPVLNFGDRRVSFSGYRDGVKVDQFSTSVVSTIINLPLTVKFRSVRISNYRPYLIAGGGMSIDISRKNDVPLMLKQLDGFVEFGVGCDFYLEYFKLAPELKMCLGFNNMIERNRPGLERKEDIKYTDAISRLTSRLIVLTFNFE